MIDQITVWDGTLLVDFQHCFVQDTINSFMIALTHLGDHGFLWILIALFLLIPKKTRKYGFLTLVAMLLTLMVNNFFLKNAIARVRPYENFPEVIRLIEKQSDYSFPSGHSANGFAAAVSMYLYLPKKIGIPAVIIAISIALSRLYVGVHYPLDVVGGALIGSFMAWIVYKIDEKKNQNELDMPKHFAKKH